MGLCAKIVYLLETIYGKICTSRASQLIIRHIKKLKDKTLTAKSNLTLGIHLIIVLLPFIIQKNIENSNFFHITEVVERHFSNCTKVV